MYFLPLACKEGYFGRNCSQVCSPNCKPDTCRHTDGSCTCAAGYMDYNCTTGKYITANLYFTKSFMALNSKTVKGKQITNNK